jgi:hypothetical protein
MTYARRVDANHGEIGDALRACGFLVLDLSRFGEGVPDYLVKHGGFWSFIEVKTRQGKLTPDQQTFSELWPVVVVQTVEQVIALRKRVV